MPTSPLLTPRSTWAPRPRAPIIDAITAIANAIMIAWFTPAMIVGIASGMRTPHRICRPVAPNASAASTADGSTSRIPRLVSRMIGGTA